MSQLGSAAQADSKLLVLAYHGWPTVLSQWNQGIHLTVTINQVQIYVVLHKAAWLMLLQPFGCRTESTSKLQQNNLRAVPPRYQWLHLLVILTFIYQCSKKFSWKHYFCLTVEIMNRAVFMWMTEMVESFLWMRCAQHCCTWIRDHLMLYYLKGFKIGCTILSLDC